tara:strand:+ start:1779 stop:2531 length:753 start_codon:yes stop_codon:yes gene_type:complete
MRLKPFFSYYGSKWLTAPHYPHPAEETIVEPFCGSACYSLLYPWKRVELYDLDPLICSVWDYLINVSEREILQLPDLLPDQTTEDLSVSQEAKYLIGFWLLNAGSTPRKIRSSLWDGGVFWSAKIRRRIASQIHRIRHWTITNTDYRLIPNKRATWFIDPPYQEKGIHYRHSSKAIEFHHLAKWSQERTGTVIVCENDGAEWMDFSPLYQLNGQRGKTTESVWIKNNPQQNLFDNRERNKTNESSNRSKS